MAHISPTIRASTGGGDKPHVMLVPDLAGCNTAREGKGPDSDATTTLIPFAQNQRDELRVHPGVCGERAADAGMKQQTFIAFNHQAGGTQTTLGYDPDSSTTGALVANQTPAIVGAGVRRLTPRECERLQGFPDVEKTVTMFVCQEAEKQEGAPFAGLSSVAPRPGPSKPADVRVLIDLERQDLRVLSHGRLIWLVNAAAPESSYPLRMPVADFVRLAALMTQTLASPTRSGRVVLPASIKPSSHPWNGSAFVRLSGHEIDALANDAEKLTSAATASMKSIISGVGQSSPSYERTLETLCCCVTAAISSFIPEKIRGESSFTLSIETTQGYTLIPYRGKPAADGPRYKALGNSMAVPVMAWIGRRIAAVDLLG